MRTGLILAATVTLAASALAAAMPAKSMPLVGPPNDLHGAGTIASPGATQDWMFIANPAGGDVTLLGTPAATLQVEMDLRDPNSAIIGDVVGAAAGVAAALINVPLSTPGQYTITVSGLRRFDGRLRDRGDRHWRCFDL